MAAALDYDIPNRIIYVTKTPVSEVITLDVVTEVYSAVKADWKDNADLNKMKFCFDPSGGEVIKGTQYKSNYYFLVNNWRMRPYEGDHTCYLENGYIGVKGGGEPWVKTIGHHQILIRDVLPLDSITTQTGISGLTQEESDYLTLLAATHGHKKELDPDTNQMKVYNEAGDTVLYTFDVFDENGDPNVFRPFKVVPV